MAGVGGAYKQARKDVVDMFARYVKGCGGHVCALCERI